MNDRHHGLRLELTGTILKREPAKLDSNHANWHWCQSTNSPISSLFKRKKFLSLCSIVKNAEWNGIIKIDN